MTTMKEDIEVAFILKGRDEIDQAMLRMANDIESGQLKESIKKSQMIDIGREPYRERVAQMLHGAVLRDIFDLVREKTRPAGNPLEQAISVVKAMVGVEKLEINRLISSGTVEQLEGYKRLKDVCKKNNLFFYFDYISYQGENSLNVGIDFTKGFQESDRVPVAESLRIGSLEKSLWGIGSFADPKRLIN